MSKLSRAEETILRNQKCILELLVTIHGGVDNVIFYANQRLSYTEQFLKDCGNN